MVFKDPVVYLVIKIWIKSKLSKITLQQKFGLVKIENPNSPIATKNWAQEEAPNSARTIQKELGP